MSKEDELRMILFENIKENSLYLEISRSATIIDVKNSYWANFHKIEKNPFEIILYLPNDGLWNFFNDIYIERVIGNSNLVSYPKFISVENITLLSVSSDDFLHAVLEVPEHQMRNYSSYVKKKKKKKKFKFTGEGRGGQNIRC